METSRNGKKTVVISDTMKTESSRRTLPLIPDVEEILLKHKAKQEAYQKQFRKGYSQQYMTKSPREKRKEIPVGLFSANKNNNPHGNEQQGSVCEGYFDDTVLTLRGAEKTKFKRMLETLLADAPDTLTVGEVAKLTGYADSTILRYINRRYIYAVKICGRYAISKKSIINYFAKDKAFRNTQKSEWHESTILKFQTTK